MRGGGDYRTGESVTSDFLPRESASNLSLCDNYNRLWVSLLLILFYEITSLICGLIVVVIEVSSGSGCNYNNCLGMISAEV